VTLGLTAACVRLQQLVFALPRKEGARFLKFPGARKLEITFGNLLGRRLKPMPDFYAVTIKLLLFANLRNERVCGVKTGVV
jgi:hypothetical protein